VVVTADPAELQVQVLVEVEVPAEQQLSEDITEEMPEALEVRETVRITELLALPVQEQPAEVVVAEEHQRAQLELEVVEVALLEALQY
jgi:hypothetical protein